MTRRRRRHQRRGSPPAPPPPPSLENDDLLHEILLRIPPQPSSLPRASAVCRRWRRVAVDPKFTARFRAHHGKPPLLGFSQRRDDGIVFAPVLDAPDRVPPERLDLPRCDSEAHLLGCRHGRVLVFDVARAEVLVCNPITGEQRRVAVPPEFKTGHVNGAVLCADRSQGHMHGGCRSSPFKVVLVFMRSHDHRPLACVYSSEINSWGHLIQTEAPHPVSDSGSQSTLVGNVLYWLLNHAEDDGILQFDLDRHSLNVIEAPPRMSFPCNCQIIQAEDGTLGLAILSHRYHNFQVWQRKVNCHGVGTWVLRKTTEMHDILGLPPPIEVARRGRVALIRGYAEDANEIFLYLDGTVYMVQLKSMQSRKLWETHHATLCNSFNSFYMPGDCSSLVLTL
ncbi:LOW QUALITY PROTEIN: hypothetical protein CFC21_015200 [Triticum aestivum]|uniref:F-box domain-containing protein n=2 Tax=Triticum aestivum TaxID=4565 RepID=A0A9R1DWH8_WHEAT|nr:LOW QUALITY PROTEIN: hypothetical protein CFC21_015200 [Triticum aestivum]